MSTISAVLRKHTHVDCDYYCYFHHLKYTCYIKLRFVSLDTLSSALARENELRTMILDGWGFKQPNLVTCVKNVKMKPKSNGCQCHQN